MALKKETVWANVEQEQENGFEAIHILAKSTSPRIQQYKTTTLPLTRVAIRSLSPIQGESDHESQLRQLILGVDLSFLLRKPACGVPTV